MADAMKLLEKLEQDYQTRRANLIAEAHEAERKLNQAAMLDQARQEAAAAAEQLSAARAALEKNRGQVFDGQLSDLVTDAEAWKDRVEQTYRDLEALIAMGPALMSRAQALAGVVGSLAVRHGHSFETRDEQLDWINTQLSRLPNSTDLAPSSQVIRTDAARCLGVRTIQQSRLSSAYQQRAAGAMKRGD